MIFKPVKATDWDPSLKKKKIFETSKYEYRIYRCTPPPPNSPYSPPFEFMTSSLLRYRGLMTEGAGGEETSQWVGPPASISLVDLPYKPNLLSFALLWKAF